jgi:methyl-accepting chemotaxis protein
MIEEIGQISDSMKSMEDSVDKMHASMSEVTKGTTEAAASAQKQLERTEQIQDYISHVKDTAAQIEKSMQETAGKVSEGKERMELLASQADKSMAANTQVLEQMKSLAEYTGQMNTIIDTITSIANSTVMLALNASIEAARAGEAGRGFAVVATQISDLASQTKSATVNITNLIEHIGTNLTSVEEAVAVVTESNKMNTESSRVVTENFAGITKSTEGAEHQAEELLEIVSDLENANKDIVENIQTVTAVTEQVSAHANETYEDCDENAALAISIISIVKDLSDKAKYLHNAK